MFSVLVSIIITCVGAVLIRDGISGIVNFISKIFKKEE